MAAPDRSLLARWLELTRSVLPGLAMDRRWPISADHCFMRVCLDAAVGGPWHEVIARPAVRHIDDATLARAIAFAEAVADGRADLAALNARSLRGRRRGAIRMSEGA